MCIGLVWQRLVAGGGYRGGFCEKLLEASTVPKGANASQLWHNRIKKGGEQLCNNLQLERGVGECERNSCADTKVSEGGGGGAPEQRFPCSLIISHYPTLS